MSIPEEYTEMACLLAFVRRLAAREGNTALERLCDAADRGDPSALQELCAPLVAAVRSVRS